MGYFVSGSVGLILAFLNTLTVLLLLYMVLQHVGAPDSKVFQVLDRIFSPVLKPVRQLLIYFPYLKNSRRVRRKV